MYINIGIRLLLLFFISPQLLSETGDKIELKIEKMFKEVLGI